MFADIQKRKEFTFNTARNVKGSPSGRRKMIPDGNMDLPKGMKSSGKGNYMSEYVRFFCNDIYLFQR